MGLTACWGGRGSKQGRTSQREHGGDGGEGAGVGDQAEGSPQSPG